MPSIIEDNIDEQNDQAVADTNEKTVVENPEMNRRQANEKKRNSQESVNNDNEYHRKCLIDVEDQVETSKLVLQLVTESRFNMTQVNGQRKLGGPPPGWKGPAPGPGCEVFVGKIPRTLYEHEIYPVFQKMGEVYEIRLMMDFSGTNRGYCFVMFGKPEFAQRAIQELDNFEIRPGRRIGVVASINNCRLFVGQLPPEISSEIVIRKIYDITDDVGQVSVYRSSNDQARYALISYKTHRGAAMARRRLVPERAALFGGTEVTIDWAHPSMFPSNVVEESGMCDEQGNLEISRSTVNSDSKRCQNRRRARDDFLENSIRSYLQTDRGLMDQTPQGRQPVSHPGPPGHGNSSLSELEQSLGLGTTTGRSFLASNDRNSAIFERSLCSSTTTLDHGFESPDRDRSSAHRSLRSSPRGRYSRTGRDRRNSSLPETYRKSSKPGSCSSESSRYSSQSSLVSERSPHLVSREFPDPVISNFGPTISRYPPQNFNPLYGQSTGQLIDITGLELAEGGQRDPKPPKNETQSLNLFENYSFSLNTNDAKDSQDNEGHLGLKAGPSKIIGDHSRPFVREIGENSVIGNRLVDNCRNVYPPRNSFAHPENLQVQNAFPKAVGVPMQHERHSAPPTPTHLAAPWIMANAMPSPYSPISQTSSNLVCKPNFSSNLPPNLHLCRQNLCAQMEANRAWQALYQISNFNETGFTDRNRAAEIFQCECRGKTSTPNVRKIGYPPPSNPQNSANARRDWISSQLPVNAYDSGIQNCYGMNAVGTAGEIVAVNNQRFLGHPSPQIANTSSHFTGARSIGSVLGPAGYRRAQIEWQNKKSASTKQAPKGGRPILNRSHTNESGEN